MSRIHQSLSMGFAISLVLGSVHGTTLSAAEAAPIAPGVGRMAEILGKLVREADPIASPFMNVERAKLIEQQLPRAATPIQRVNLETQWAIELLNAGETDQAIQVFDRVAAFYRSNEATIPAANQSMLRTFRAIAYLRQAEQDNCLTNHTSESCLFPISGAGVHQVQRGSRAAVEVLKEQLTAAPSDLRARWLLNLAFMTLGEYPDQVPAQWRLEPKLFESSYDIRRFPDIAAGLGLDIDDLAGGSIAEDFDGDGYLDIMASSMALRGQLRYFRNNADGTFTERTVEAGLIGEIGGLNIVQTDYNNDGWTDVLVLRGGWMLDGGKYPLSLLRNKGNGTFDDVTIEAGLLRFHPTQTAVWWDYNGDGWLDLFVGNESGGQTAHPCELFRNNGDGTFTECAAAMGLAMVAYVKGVASADFNNDGRPDLYVSIRDQPNTLFRNDGPQGEDKSAKAPWKFTDLTAAAGVREPVTSFPTWFFDYDNDGWPDLFVSGYDLKTVGDIAADYLGQPYASARAKLFHNKGNGTFADVTQAAGVDHLLHTMGCNYGDLDNDGFLDFYLGTGDPSLGTLVPNRMFRNAGGHLFQDVTQSGGFGHLQKGHGVSFADFDNDGDQDIYEVMGGAYSGDHYRNAFFENPGHGNHWLCLKLEGVQSNRAAIGAQIKLKLQTPKGARAICRTVGTGSSFGANPLRQEIGLGDATRIEAVEIIWPATGRKQSVSGCSMDRFYKVVEGKNEAAEVTLKTFRLRADAAGPQHHHHH